jgi:AcrR family transcriptional regulator
METKAKAPGGTASEIGSRQGAHVVEMQRRRLLSAFVEVLGEHGYEGATVGRICKRAGVSRRTFYDLYDDREGCFLDAFEVAIQRFASLVAPAYASGASAQAGSVQRAGSVQGAGSWRERVRGALTVLMEGFDREPGVARLCLVETLKGGPAILERRRAVTEALTTAVDEGRAPRGAGVARGASRRAQAVGVAEGAGPPALTAESLVGGAVSVIHARLLQRDAKSPGERRGGAGDAPGLVELVNPLMSMIVLPYLGPAAARRELERPLPTPSRAVKASNGHVPVPASDPFKGLPIRITFRTMRVLATIAEQGGRGAHPSNREIGQDAGVADQGQMSKLLRRLEKAGLIENHGQGQIRGEANAWQLTPQGQGVLHAVGGDGA